MHITVFYLLSRKRSQHDHDDAEKSPILICYIFPLIMMTKSKHQIAQTIRLDLSCIVGQDLT